MAMDPDFFEIGAVRASTRASRSGRWIPSQPPKAPRSTPGSTAAHRSTASPARNRPAATRIEGPQGNPRLTCILPFHPGKRRLKAAITDTELWKDAEMKGLFAMAGLAFALTALAPVAVGADAAGDKAQIDALYQKFSTAFQHKDLTAIMSVTYPATRCSSLTSRLRASTSVGMTTAPIGRAFSRRLRGRSPSV